MLCERIKCAVSILSFCKAMRGRVKCVCASVRLTLTQTHWPEARPHFTSLQAMILTCTVISKILVPICKFAVHMHGTCCLCILGVCSIVVCCWNWKENGQCISNGRPYYMWISKWCYPWCTTIWTESINQSIKLKLNVVKIDRDGHCLLNAVTQILRQSNKVNISNTELCETVKRELMTNACNYAEFVADTCQFHAETDNLIKHGIYNSDSVHFSYTRTL